VNYYSLTKAFSCVIFDYDKTICSLNLNWEKYRREFRTFSHNTFPVKFNDRMRVDQMEKILIERFPSDVKKIFSFRRKVEEQIVNLIPNYKLVEFISVCNQQLFIVSNNLTHTVETGLRFLGIHQKFTEIIGVDFFNIPKPSTVSWEYLSDKYKLNYTNTIFIGDSPENDGVYAKNAGIYYHQITC
jgi:FMN phosphatase YigB (HAD superfamily)